MTLFHHSRNHGLSAQKGTNQVNIHYLAKVRGAHFRHGNALDDARIVDQNVDRPDVLLDLLHQRLNLIFLRHIRDIALRVNAQRRVIRQRLLQIFLRAAVERDLRPCHCQSLRNGKSDAVSRAGHERRFPFQ